MDAFQTLIVLTLLRILFCDDVADTALKFQFEAELNKNLSQRADDGRRRGRSSYLADLVSILAMQHEDSRVSAYTASLLKDHIVMRWSPGTHKIDEIAEEEKEFLRYRLCDMTPHLCPAAQCALMGAMEHIAICDSLSISGRISPHSSQERAIFTDRWTDFTAHRTAPRKTVSILSSPTCPSPSPPTPCAEKREGDCVAVLRPREWPLLSLSHSSPTLEPPHCAGSHGFGKRRLPSSSRIYATAFSRQEEERGAKRQKVSGAYRGPPFSFPMEEFKFSVGQPPLGRRGKASRRSRSRRLSPSPQREAIPSLPPYAGTTNTSPSPPLERERERERDSTHSSPPPHKRVRVRVRVVVKRKSSSALEPPCDLVCQSDEAGASFKRIRTNAVKPSPLEPSRVATLISGASDRGRPSRVTAVATGLALNATGQATGTSVTDVTESSPPGSEELWRTGPAVHATEVEAHASVTDVTSPAGVQSSVPGTKRERERLSLRRSPLPRL